MKNKILALLLISTLILVTGCDHKKVEEETVVIEDKQEEENLEPVIEEKEVELEEKEKNAPIEEAEKDKTESQDSAEVVEESNSSLQDLRNKIGSMNKEEGTLAVEKIEEKLNVDLEPLIDQVIATDKDLELQNLEVPSIDFPEERISEINNEELKALVKKSIDQGYKFMFMEGMYLPMVDYSKLYEFKDSVNEEYANYLAIQSKEAKEPSNSGGGMIISMAELGERLIKTEEYLKSYKDSNRYEKIKDFYSFYLTSFLQGLPNTPIIDEERKLIPDAVDNFNNIIKLGEYEASKATAKYLELIENNGGVVSEEIINSSIEIIEEAKGNL